MGSFQSQMPGVLLHPLALWAQHGSLVHCPGYPRMPLDDGKQTLLLNMAIEIVDLPIENGHFP